MSVHGANGVEEKGKKLPGKYKKLPQIMKSAEAEGYSWL